MRSATLLTGLAAILPAFAQGVSPASAPASSIAIPTPTSSSNSSAPNVNAIVSYLIPTLGSTSLSPSQSSALLFAGSSYLSSYTSASPLSSLQSAIIVQAIFATTTPSQQEQASLSSLIQGAETGLVNDPEGYIGSIESVISPFNFATKIRSYENGFTNGLATVVAQQLSVEPPAPTPLGADEGGVATGNAGRKEAMMGAVGIVAGAIGVGLL